MTKCLIEILPAERSPQSGPSSESLFLRKSLCFSKDLKSRVESFGSVMYRSNLVL